MNFPLCLHTVSLQHQTVELYVPDEEAVRDAYRRGLVAFPYWSRVWPAAKSLAEFLSSFPAYTENKTVLELGAGLGLPSLVAARNAASVWCTDHIPEAVEAVEKSAARLRLQNLRASVLDWNCLPATLAADVLLLSDVNYDPAAFAVLVRVIESFLQSGTTVIMSTPQRLVAKDFVTPLLRHSTNREEIVVEHEGGKVATTVVVLKHNTGADNETTKTEKW